METKKTAVRSKKSTAGNSGRRVVYLEYASTPGKKVFAAGSFNDWKPDKQLVDKGQCGLYRCQLRLFPGEYQYKFMVDDNWCLDAENPNFVPNGFGTLNSLLIVRDKQEEKTDK